MIFRQLFDHDSSTYTYLLADTPSRQAVLIDPVYEQVHRDLALIHELELDLVATLESHCHADHVTGAWQIKQATASVIACATVIGADNVDIALTDGDTVRFGKQTLEVRATPGHTDGCLSFVWFDQRLVFTGDALLIRGCGRCDFQQGDAHRLYQSVHQQLFTLPDDFLVYPGHDYQGRAVSSIGEEKRYNQRLGAQASVHDFVTYMSAMQLPHPKKLAEALPANLRSGRNDSQPIPPHLAWGEVRINFAGVAEISPQWLKNNLNDVHLVDVRDPNESLEDDDALPTKRQQIPLTQLHTRLDEIPQDKPIVVVCRSGRRSALAVQILTKAGLTQVANLAGGALHWENVSPPTSVTI